VAAPGSVAVYWGPGDGGTDPSQWQYTNSFGVLPSCGFLLTNVSFPAGGSYYYRYCLSNDDVVAWAAPPATFCAGEIAVYADDSQSAETGPDEGVFTVCREASATSAPLIVNYAVAGTASNGADYLPLAGTVTIAAGQTSEVVTVIPIDDEVWKEGFETVELTLAPGSYLISSQDQATVYIADNDLPFNWAFEMPVIFSGYDGLGTLTDFVALVCLDSTIPGFTYSNFASPFGYDLRFVNDTGMRLLPYEIEVWNTNGRSLLWVQAPELAGNDTTIWAYWGDKDLTNTPTFLTNGATWSRDFQIVYHYNQESGDIVDSSPNRNHGLNTGLSFTTGLVGNCIEVDDHDGITIPAVTNEELSACMWYYFTETGDDDWSTPFGINGSSYMHLMIADDTRQVGFYNWGWYSSGTVLATNQWHFLYIVANGSSYKLYHNGQSTPIMQSGSFFNNAAHNMQSVASAVPGAWYETWGRVEETRIENVSRSGDWTRACWLNMMSNETFVSFGEIAPWGGSVFIIR
jgi:hypothetical protein